MPFDHRLFFLTTAKERCIHELKSVKSYTELLESKKVQVPDTAHSTREYQDLVYDIGQERERFDKISRELADVMKEIAVYEAEEQIAKTMADIDAE